MNMKLLWKNDELSFFVIVNDKLSSFEDIDFVY